MKQVLCICLLLFIASVNIPAQSKNTKTNLEIFEKSISGEFEKLFFLPGVDRNKEFVFYAAGYTKDLNVVVSGNSSFVVSVLRRAADKLNLKYSVAKESWQFDSDTSFNKFKISKAEIRTSYPKFIKNKFLGEKTIERKLNADIDVQISSGKQDTKQDEKIHIDYTDEIELDNYESVETDEYSFTKAVPPGVSSFESVFFPAIIVIVSAAATILFFTIRTK